MIRSQRSTWCRVRIVTPQIRGQASEVFEWDAARPRTSALRDLQTVVVEQDMSGSPNRFHLIFAPDHIEHGTSWARRIPPYSLVQIEMGSSEAPDDDPLLMVGLTSPGIESEDWTETAPNRRVVVPGLGIERVLAEANVWRAPWLVTHNIDPELDRVTRGPFNQTMTGQPTWRLEIFKGVVDPREALLRVLFFFLVDHKNAVVNLLLPPPFRIFDLLVPGDFTDADVEATRLAYDPDVDFGTPGVSPSTWTLVDDRLKLTAAGLPPQGPVAGFLHACLDPVFQEWFVRYQAGKARLLFRRRPFFRRAPGEEAPPRGRTMFEDGVTDLETFEITSGDVMKAQLRMGSDPVFNTFYAQPGQTTVLQAHAWRANVPPTFCGRETDEAYVGRWGLRPLDHVSPYLLIDSRVQDMATATQAAADLNRTLKSWYDPHPIMQQGSLLVRGRSAYRCGQRLVWRGEDGHGRKDGRATREFYIEGGRHTYDCHTGAFVSELTVTRGWPIGGVAGPHAERQMAPSPKARAAAEPDGGA